MSDLRYAIRTLTGNPALSLLIVLTLGLGIGANGAIFSAVHGLLLRPAPFKDPDRLVRITTARGDEAGGAVATPEFDDLRTLPVIEDAAMYTDQGMYNASGFGTPEELQATITTHSLFRVLGVEPMIGGTFPDSFDRTRQFGLVISHGLWTRKFGQDPNVVGRTMTLDGAAGYTIHGVMPASFNFPSTSDLFRSNGISADPAYYRRRDARDRFVVARIRQGTSIEQARSAIDNLSRRLEQEFPSTNAGLRFRVTPIAEMYTGAIRPYVLLLFGAVVLVLVIACANVGNLLLSRVIARDREIAVRTALGASRWRIVRQLLVESLLLSTLGAIVGLGLAIWGVRLLIAMVPVQLPQWMRIAVDGRVVAFLAVTSIVTGLAAGLVPGGRTGAAALHESLKGGSRTWSDGRRRHWLRDGLVVAEVALALVLLVGASLLLQSVWRLHHVDPGFRTASTLTFRTELGWAAYNSLEKTVDFHRRVLAKIEALPGVQAVTFDYNLPMSGKPRDPFAIRFAGQGRDDEARNPYVNLHLVGPSYFEVMGIPIRAGRGFNDDDRAAGAPVVVVSRRLAERLWPDRDPIGQRIQTQNTTAPAVWLEVIGVCEAVLHYELDASPGFDMYRPYTQSSTAGPWYVIRTAGDPMAVARAATAVIGETDPNQSFLDVQTYDRRVANRIWPRRLAGALFGAFAGLALVLAAVGVYGVLSYLISQQTREIGIRMALGASSRAVILMVLGRGMALTTAGLGVGLLIAFVLARSVASLLYEVSPADPATFTLMAIVLVATAAIACYVPVRRAARVDPIVALRVE